MSIVPACSRISLLPLAALGRCVITLHVKQPQLCSLPPSCQLTAHSATRATNESNGIYVCQMSWRISSVLLSFNRNACIFFHRRAHLKSLHDNTYGKLSVDTSSCNRVAIWVSVLSQNKTQSEWLPKCVITRHLYCFLRSINVNMRCAWANLFRGLDFTPVACWVQIWWKSIKRYGVSHIRNKLDR